MEKEKGIEGVSDEPIHPFGLRIRKGIVGSIRFVINKLESHERLMITILALLIGVIGGYGAILFRMVIHFIEELSFNTHEKILAVIGSVEWWRRFIPPVIGLSLVAPLVHWLAKEAKGHGVPEVMEAVALHGGIIRVRVVFVKLLASAMCIGTGGSVGREGPIVQIGSAAGSVLGQLTNASRRRIRILVGCGAAAGLAATFNAPIAGVLFSLEILLGEYGTMTLSPIVISSVIATVVSRSYLGNHPAFIIPPELTTFQMASLWEIGTFLLLGLVAGVLGVLFSRSVYFAEDIFDGIKLPVWVKGFIGSLFVAMILVFVPNVGGVGYDTIEGLMRVDIHTIVPPQAVTTLVANAWLVVLILFVAKLLATSLTLGLGGSGGIFAPSLFLGASAGYLFGTIFNAVMPGAVSSPAAYALVGMGAMVAGATHAPMTSIIILFEMTNDYKIILPLMLACILSTLISTRLDPESIYTRKLARRGVKIRSGRDESVLSGINVGQIMNPNFQTIPQRARYFDIVRQVTTGRQIYFPVVNDEERMIGILGFHDLREHLFDEQLQHLVIALDLAVTDVITLTPKDSLLVAFEKFNIKDIEQMPVVDPIDQQRVVGVISRRDLLDAYNKEVLKKSMDFGKDV